MIEFRESSRFWHIWFVGAEGMDWLAALFKHEGEAWQCVYRFRYHEDDLAFDSKDRRSWVTITSSSTENEPPADLLAAISQVARMTTMHFNGELHSIPVRGTGLQAAKMLLEQPWAHARAAPPEMG